MLDDEVIKAAADPFPDGVQMYHTFVFEEDEVNLMGSGLPPICRDSSQLGVCSSTRMLVDNASVCCGPQLEVDTDLLRADQDMTGVKPFKVWYREGNNAVVTGPAVRNIDINSHILELLKIIDLFNGFADKETFRVSDDRRGLGEQPERADAYYERGVHDPRQRRAAVPGHRAQLRPVHHVRHPLAG